VPQICRQKFPTLARVVNNWQMNTDTMGVCGTHAIDAEPWIALGASRSFVPAKERSLPASSNGGPGRHCRVGRRFHSPIAGAPS
jgi:hypothetical protein